MSLNMYDQSAQDRRVARRYGGVASVQMIYETAIDLPKQYYASIGEVVQRWAQLEYQLQEIIWRAMGIDNKQGRTLTAGSGFHKLAAILRTVPRRWMPNKNDAQELEGILQRATRLADERNLLAHGSWQHLPGKKDDVCLADMRESALRIMPRALRRAPYDLGATAKKLRELNVRAQKLIERLEAASTP